MVCGLGGVEVGETYQDVLYERIKKNKVKVPACVHTRAPVCAHTEIYRKGKKQNPSDIKEDFDEYRLRLQISLSMPMWYSAESSLSFLT